MHPDARGALRERAHAAAEVVRELWQALAPFRDRLAPLSVFLVEYPQPVVMPLPPATSLISPAEDPEG